jgi:hypothetical protein
MPGSSSRQKFESFCRHVWSDTVTCLDGRDWRGLLGGFA